MGVNNKVDRIFEYSKEKLVDEILYHKFAISYEKTALRLTLSFTLFQNRI